MSKEKEIIKLSTTVDQNFDNIFRRHAYTLRLKNNEVLELYQKAYLEKIEREKAEKKRQKEQAEAEKEKKE